MEMKMTVLRNVATYVSDKIDVADISIEDYISTENMIPNKGGITPCQDAPSTHRVTRYQEGDILVSNIRPYFKKIWKADKSGGCSNDVLVFRAKGINPDYLYYALSQDAFFAHMMAGANGTKMPRGNKKLIPNFEIPDLDTAKQELIVSLLLPYDELIANCQKQITLLEEAAQRLYREWFVNLRFPGHETTPIGENGLPEGWRWRCLGEVTEINKETISDDYKGQFIDYIDLGSVKSGDIGTSSRCDLSRAPGRAKRIAHDGDVIWGMVRPNLKSYALIQHPSDSAVFSTGFAVLTPSLIPFSYLYEVVTQEVFVNYLVSVTNGAAYPAVKPVHFENAPILIPDASILSDYHSFCYPFFRMIENCKTQIVHLQEIRNSLLPRLISGQIDIDA
ncbi:MAG: restriction endonuclease subunit S [Bacteroidales bacterium]|nr:restriction endonuclease subunit S [Bacteroidales bacterium]